MPVTLTRTKLFLIFIALLLFVAPFTASRSQANQPDRTPTIKLQTAHFTPTEGETPDIAPGLAISDYAQGQRGYYIVQFAGPVQQYWKDAVSAEGAELLNYIPDFAFKVRMNPAEAQRVSNLDSVAWVGIFQPAYKLSPNLVRDGTHLYTVRVEQGVNTGQVRSAIARSGANVLDNSGNLLLVAADSAQLNAIARVTDVAWVQNFHLRKPMNEYGAGVIMGANSANANGYDGSTQTVAVADTGLGGGSVNTAHPDIPSSRITAIYNWPGQTDSCFQSIDDDGAIDVDSGHGTHVSASVLSDGDANGVGTGTAPAANLVFQATENYVDVSNFCEAFYGISDGYYLVGLPADIRNLYQQAYDAGARIHSNSWGSAQAGAYTVDSANTDDFIWTNSDMTISFSAGNAGTDANSDGVIDSDSTGSPATAKNVITVGASENERADNYPCDSNLTYTDSSGNSCSSLGGQNDIFTYGEAWPNDYPADPIASDASAGDAEQMAAFSSRGPTDDGRIKPDVVAPGTWILSGYSDLYQQGYGDSMNPKNGAYQYDGYGFPYSSSYKYMSGTSMSNPLTAGAAAVVRDFYQKAHSLNASAALVKATLINSAVDMLDENNDSADDNDYPIPNDHEGWGRVNVANATDGSHQFEDASGLSTGATASYDYSVGTSGNAFNVTLVWSDYPSTESASQNLVNDLDLVVTSPSGATYRGNNFSGGWSQTGGSADRTNNVENVYVQSADAGTWTVEVSGYNVPNGPQPYALVVDGTFGTVDTPTPTPTSEPTNTPAPTDTPTATNTPGPTNTPAPTATPTNTPTPTDTPEPTNTPAPTATPDSSTLHVGDLDGNSINNGRTWQAEVTITVHDAGGAAVANATVNGTWTGGTSRSDSCVTDGSGQCTVASDSMRKNNGSTTFTVDSVSHGSLTYDSSANHDPDGDSNGTSITVTK